MDTIARDILDIFVVHNRIDQTRHQGNPCTCCNGSFHAVQAQSLIPKSEIISLAAIRSFCRASSLEMSLVLISSVSNRRSLSSDQQIFFRIGEDRFEHMIGILMGGVIVGDPDIGIGFIDRIHLHLFNTGFWLEGPDRQAGHVSWDRTPPART